MLDIALPAVTKHLSAAVTDIGRNVFEIIRARHFSLQLNQIVRNCGMRVSVDDGYVVDKEEERNDLDVVGGDESKLAHEIKRGNSLLITRSYK